MLGMVTFVFSNIEFEVSFVLIIYNFVKKLILKYELEIVLFYIQLLFLISL